MCIREFLVKSESRPCNRLSWRTFCGFSQSLQAYHGTLPVKDYEILLQNPSPFITDGSSCNLTFGSLKTVVGTASALRDGRSGVQVPAKPRDFSQVQNVETASGTHIASYLICRGSFFWKKAAGAWVWPLNSFNTKVKNKSNYASTVELCICCQTMHLLSNYASAAELRIYCRTTHLLSNYASAVELCICCRIMHLLPSASLRREQR
jgi:hypothetical protein